MKDMEEMIAIMQAYKEGKQIQIKIKGDNYKWTDYLLSDTEWDWKTFDYRVKPDKDLPETWEEFCENYPVKKGEAFADMYSDINVYENEHERIANEDKNILPDKKYADAILTLCQLIQLRDCYNEGWQPNWKDYDQYKYCIIFDIDRVTSGGYTTTSHVLAFKTAELSNKFLKNFRDLIEIAKPLL